jgi:hypothetical protein
VREWVQGEATTLEELTGKPTMLLFWSPSQDRVVPTTGYVRHLLELAAGSDLQTVAICDWAAEAADVNAYLAEHALPGFRVAIDGGGETYDSYFLKAGFHGYPRILLLDAEGAVRFEGSLGLPGGREWQEGDAVIVDQPLRALLGR